MTLFTAAIDQVRQERAEIVAIRDELMAKAERLSVDIDIANGKLYALDFALKAMEEQPAEVEEAPPRRKRLNIAAAVTDFLEAAGSPHTIEELAAGIDRKPSQVSAAAMRLSAAGAIELVPGTSDRYRLVNREAAQAAQ